MPGSIGYVTPESDNGPLQRAAIEGQGESNAGDSAAHAATSQQAQARTKEVATVAAEAALLRCALHPLDGGGFVVTRTGWGLSRRLDSLDQVRRLLRLMAGGQGGAQ